MGRKQPWCRKHFYFNPANGVKTVILILVLVSGPLLWTDSSLGKTDSDWQSITRCFDTQTAPEPEEKMLQCIVNLKGQWPAGSSQAEVLLILERLLEANAELNLELSEKKEIIRILIEQIERIKMIDMEMEKRRQDSPQQ